MSSAETRREFLSGSLSAAASAVISSQGSSAAAVPPPWYRRALRWGQTNITERDPVRYDIAWWREYWKRTRVQGVIINAGGIIAYYPSKYPLQRRAEFLGGRDLYGELCRAAHQDGLFVLARMDSNRTAEDFYRAHPDWFTRDSNGEPYRTGDRYVTCVNSPYYEEYLPAVLREVIERSHPEGITDNSWSGLSRDSICYCLNCVKRFKARTGAAIPRKKDWDDPVYREWIKWNYARRLEIWDLNNRVTKAAGGPDCLWIGMNGGSPGSQSRAFRDYKEICRRAEIIMCDHQARSDSTGFQHNGESGKLIHGLLGWDKLIPESMAMYQAGRTPFRVSSKPAAEARMWMLEGFAGGIQPWWHHIGAYHEDRRMYRTAEPVMRWHEAHQEFLVNRLPVATVGVVWSQQNTDFYGRDDAEELVDLPHRGITHALIRARIPFLPVHADHLERDGPSLKLIILPNVGAMSEAQCAAVRRFVERGGSLLATGASSMYDESGQPRKDFALADLFGAHKVAHPAQNRLPGSHHTYLRLTPELRAQVWGPKAGDEPAIEGQRHPVLRGFDETDILPFGGWLDSLRTDPGVSVPLTFVPPFPVYPPETAWMREPKTDIPALILRELGNGSRIAYLPADLDRRFAKDNLPDHGNLLANLVRWSSSDAIPLQVEGRGLIDCHLYRQADRLILHLVNLTSAGTWRAAIDELIPVGPFHVRVRLPADISGHGVRSLVSSLRAETALSHGWAAFDVKSVLDHEVVVID
jgi:hypothetical protein